MARMSEFFCFYVAENVVMEHSRAAKKLILGFRQFHSRPEFELNKMQCANKVRELKHPVARRLDIVRELDVASEAIFEHFVQHMGYGGLPTVVVDFQMLERRHELTAFLDEVREVGLEANEYLISRVDELFVNAHAMISVVDSSGKCHHARKDTSAKFATEHGVILFAANKRTSVKTMPLKAYLAVGTFKTGDFCGYINGLVVEYHPDDIKARFQVRVVKVPRLVYENAQSSCSHSVEIKKRKWRDENPATHAESFPRIPVALSRRRRPMNIVAYPRGNRKGGI